jgi:hypothetical protein
LRSKAASTPDTPAISVDDASLLIDQCVIFLDFLGFSHAVTTWEIPQILPLLDLLTNLAASKSSFSIDGGAQEDGSYAIRVVPEITTFSDHIVASYPDVHLAPDLTQAQKEILTSIWMRLFLSEAKRIISGIALQAMRIGLLVRGGITIGKLYHSSGVVFGEAMVDAYNLESRVAIYPRVAVSSRVYSRIPEADRPEYLRLDRDGIWHLDYLTPMIPNAVPSGETFSDDMRKWVSDLLQIIDSNIKTFEERQRWNELAKWAWFRNEFSELIARRFPPL